MSVSETPTLGTLPTVTPAIKVGTAAGSLSPDAASMVLRVVVDTHLHLPDMFEITFAHGSASAVAQAGISIGVPLEIWGGPPQQELSKRLILGEVTSIEGQYTGSLSRIVVRGYAKSHRLQRITRTRTFVNMKDSDIARQIASDAGLTIGVIDQTRTTHDHVGQVNQTDWDFLKWHARKIGYETGVANDTFFFRKASTTAAGTPITLTYPEKLRSFYPRVTAGNLAEQVEVRVWDPLAGKVVAAQASPTGGAASLSKGNPGQFAGAFGATPAPPPAAGNPALGDLGPAPSGTAHIVSDWPLAAGPSVSSAAAETADGLAEHIGSTFAEAEGDAIGDPALQAGAVVDIVGVSDFFAGKWVITNARHTFDATEHNYRTRIYMSGRQDRSVFGLASGGKSQGRPPAINGVAGAIVSNINDPDKKSRVKVALPWLSPQYESDWASVVQFGAGKSSGAMFLPEVGDEVLVGFEFGDPQRPYVLGGIVNNATTYELGGQPVKPSGNTASVAWRGFVAASGNKLAFHDEEPPGGGTPTASEIVLGTKDGSFSLTIDQVGKKVTLTCGSGGGTLEIKSAGGTMNIDGGNQLNLKATAVNIEGSGQLNLKAAMVKVEGSGEVEIKGGVVKLN